MIGKLGKGDRNKPGAACGQVSLGALSGICRGACRLAVTLSLSHCFCTCERWNLIAQHLRRAAAPSPELHPPKGPLAAAGSPARAAARAAGATVQTGEGWTVCRAGGGRRRLLPPLCRRHRHLHCRAPSCARCSTCRCCQSCCQCQSPFHHPSLPWPSLAPACAAWWSWIRPRRRACACRCASTSCSTARRMRGAPPCTPP